MAEVVEMEDLLDQLVISFMVDPYEENIGLPTNGGGNEMQNFTQEIVASEGNLEIGESSGVGSNEKEEDEEEEEEEIITMIPVQVTDYGCSKVLQESYFEPLVYVYKKNREEMSTEGTMGSVTGKRRSDDMASDSHEEANQKNFKRRDLDCDSAKDLTLVNEKEHRDDLIMDD